MAQRKKVFLEAHNIKNMYSGFGQFNYWLIKSLITSNSAYDFIINAKSKGSIAEFKDEVIFHKYFSLSRYWLFRPAKSYDLWHSLNQNTKVEPARRMPYVLTIHDINFMEQGCTSAKDKKRKRLLEKKILKSSAITFISEYVKTSTNSFFEIPEEIPQLVIYNGNPVTILPEQPAPKNIQLHQKKPFLFCLGQFRPSKNFHTLIGMLDKLPDYQLVLAGNSSTNYGQEVLKQIEKHKLLDRIFLTGKISELEKHYYLQNCKAFLFPSLYEGFGLPPIEAMAYGKPVFLANRTSLPEIGGDFAFYWDNFDPEPMAQVFKEGIEKFDQNTDLYKSELKKRAAFFDWDTTAKSYLSLYDMLLTKR